MVIVMAEYIDREAFLGDIEKRYCLPCKEAGKDYNGCKCRACWVDDMQGDVIGEPAADVAPVVHGQWISFTGCANEGVYCSICKKKVWKSDYAWCSKKSRNKLRSNYCPNCGAKMDGGTDDGC